MQESEKNEQHYWDDFKKGDKEAFSVIYFNHYSSLYNYALKICMDREAAKDAIQELFLRLWNNRNGLAEVHSVKFYLMKALKRDLIRKLTRDGNQVMLSEMSAEINIAFSTEELMIQAETDEAQKKRLLHLLNSLPPRQKEALYLKYYEDLGNDEIAEMMAMNYQSVANLVFRGLKTLRDHLRMPFLALICYVSIFR
jgi:RNA polymerase sigma factor (sigma-70 family)